MILMKDYVRQVLNEKLTYRILPDGSFSEGMEYGHDRTGTSKNSVSGNLSKKFWNKDRFDILARMFARCLEDLGLYLFVKIDTFIDEKGDERVRLLLEKMEGDR